MLDKRFCFAVLALAVILLFSGCGGRGPAESRVQPSSAEPMGYMPGSGMFRAGSEPDGFRGIRWGTDIRDVSGMQLYPGERADRYDIYTRENGIEELAGIEVMDIYYGFWDNKFWEAVIVVQGRARFNALRDYVFRLYGEGAGVEPYFWNGDMTLMELGFIEESEVGLWGIYSIEIYRKVSDWAAGQI